MQDPWSRRIQVTALGVCLAGLPIELAVSGAVLALLAFVDYMFDPERMMRGDLESVQEHAATTAARAPEAGPARPGG